MCVRVCVRAVCSVGRLSSATPLPLSLRVAVVVTRSRGTQWDGATGATPECHQWTGGNGWTHAASPTSASAGAKTTPMPCSTRTPLLICNVLQYMTAFTFHGVVTLPRCVLLYKYFYVFLCEGCQTGGVVRHMGRRLFNGDGFESWENVWGTWNGITPRVRHLMQQHFVIPLPNFCFMWYVPCPGAFFHTHTVKYCVWCSN